MVLTCTALVQPNIHMRSLRSAGVTVSSRAIPSWERGREGVRAGGREGVRAGGREGVRVGGREGGREDGREGGSEGRREGGRERRERRKGRMNAE